MLRKRSESGETLAELLVSVAILGILAVGVVGALASDITVSSADRDTASAEAVTRSFGAWITRTLGSPSGYRACTTTGSTTNPYYGTGTGKWTSPGLGYTAPSGFSATVTGWGSNGGVTFWDGTSGFAGALNGSTANVVGTTCPSTAISVGSAGPASRGLQQLSIRVSKAGVLGAATATIQVREP